MPRLKMLTTWLRTSQPHFQCSPAVTGGLQACHLLVPAQVCPRAFFTPSPTLRPSRPDSSPTSCSRSHTRRRAALLRWPTRRGQWLLEGGRRLASPPPAPTPHRLSPGRLPPPDRGAPAQPAPATFPTSAGGAVLPEDHGHG